MGQCSDAEVLTSPTMQEQRPQEIVLGDGDTAALGHDDWAFVAGFRDCADDAVRYLTQVERLPENDVIIRGLRQHLSTNEPDIVRCDRARSASSDEGYTSMCVDDTVSVDLSTSLVGDDSACTHCVATGVSKDTDNTTPGGSTGQTLDDVGATLARLLRCDPRIASLTKEIFDLIDGVSDDDDNEEEDYNIDSTRL